MKIETKAELIMVEKIQACSNDIMDLFRKKSYEKLVTYAAMAAIMKMLEKDLMVTKPAVSPLTQSKT